MIAKGWDIPIVALCPECPGVPDCAPLATFGIDEQFGARTEPSPSKRHTGRSNPLPGTKLTFELQKARGATYRYEDGDPAQPASL